MNVLFYAKYPLGIIVRQFFEEFNKIDYRKYKTVVLKPYKKDVEFIWGTPNFWVILGWGSGLKIFSDPEKNYQLYAEKNNPEDSIIVELDGHMKIHDIILPATK